MQSSVDRNHLWDFIIVGTGMGGSTLGLKLAQSGLSVLFLEKGLSSDDPTALKGQFAELFYCYNQNQAKSRAGRSNLRLIDFSNRKVIEPLIGSGTGGSSSIYGAVLQRFKESDFKNWPLNYGDFQKYYLQAEELFEVKKSLKISHLDIELIYHYLKDQGVTPYTLPLAHESKVECGSCQSYLCDKGCKNDTNKICLDPAIKKFGAKLLVDCEVLKIEVEDTKVSGVLVKYRSEQFSLKAKNVILAAGALASPLLLLETKTNKFPFGLGNQSDQVGRNLMRHYIDLYALKIDSDPNNPDDKKIGFDDFYQYQGVKYGTVQSFGRLPPFQVIVESLKKEFLLFKCFHLLVAWILRIILKNRIVFASILEDFPDPKNRIFKSKEEVFIDYKISDSDRERISFIRKKLKKIFSSFGLILVKCAEKNEMLAHVCGTCKMGNDPSTSVVNLDNRVHGLENLYIVDSSFFPSSGGTNPALTIAANALRVAEKLI